MSTGKSLVVLEVPSRPARRGRARILVMLISGALSGLAALGFLLLPFGAMEAKSIVRWGDEALSRGYVEAARQIYEYAAVVMRWPARPSRWPRPTIRTSLPKSRRRSPPSQRRRACGTSARGS
jgi:hypothetical protein